MPNQTPHNKRLESARSPSLVRARPTVKKIGRERLRGRKLLRGQACAVQNRARRSKILKEPHLILGVGELLWDLLPEGPQPGGVPIDGSTSRGWLGGGPTNFAVMAGRLG